MFYYLLKSYLMMAQNTFQFQIFTKFLPLQIHLFLQNIYFDWHKRINNGKLWSKAAFARKIHEIEGIINGDRKTINGKRGRGIYISNILIDSTFVSEISGEGLITKSLANYFTTL